MKSSELLIYSKYFWVNSPSEEMDKDVYIKAFNDSLNLVDLEHINSIKDIYLFISIAKSMGMMRVLLSQRFYFKLTKGRTEVFITATNYFKAKKLKMLLLDLYTDDCDKEKFIEALIFFGYLSEDIVVNEDNRQNYIDDCLMSKDLFMGMREVSAKETYFYTGNKDLISYLELNPTIIGLIQSMMDHTDDVRFELGRVFKNKYSNIVQSCRITFTGKRGDTSVVVYLPLMINGIYSLGTNSFSPNMYHEEYSLGRPNMASRKAIGFVINSFLRLSKAYYISEENKEIVRKDLQLSLNNIFFTNVEFRLSAQEIQDLADEEGVTFIQATALAEDRAFKQRAFTLVKSRMESMTPFEIFLQQHKVYYTKYNTTTGSEGELILKNFGRKGYGKYRHLPLNDEYKGLYDYFYINNKGDFSIAKIGDKGLDLLNPFSMMNHVSFRNAGSAHILGHAFETIKPEPRLTISCPFMVEPPSYNMWFGFVDYVDGSGLSTNEGQRLINKEYAEKLKLWEGTKIAYNGYDKGVSRIMQDDVYFIHNGEKIFVNLTSLVNMAGRLNLGVLYEGLYNGNKKLHGDDSVEIRDFYTKPLKEGELLPMKELFRDGVSLGKHPVGYMASYLVRDMDSSYQSVDEEDEEELVYKRYKLGLEWFARARLRGAKQLVMWLLHATDFKYDKTLTLDENYRAFQALFFNEAYTLAENGEGKLFGKYGKVTQKFQSEVAGFSSTVFGNVNVKPSEAHLYVVERELPLFLLNLKRAYPKMDIEKVREDLEFGKDVKVPVLQLRHPSIDDANSIYVNLSIHLTHNPFAKNSYIEVNPLVWARQGGDFDGDLGQFIFLPFFLKSEAMTHFSFIRMNIEEPSFEYKARDILFGKQSSVFSTKHLRDVPLESSKRFEDIPSYLYWIGLVKKDEAYASKLRDLHLVHLTHEQVLNSAIPNLFTTHVSKQLIGVAKSITMKALFFLENLFDYVGTQELKDKFVDYLNAMNNEIVQNVINIQKWSNDLHQVVRWILITYRMNEAISALIEWDFYPTKHLFYKVKDMYYRQGLIQKGRVIGQLEFKNKLDEMIYGHCDLGHSRFLVEKEFVSQYDGKPYTKLVVGHDEYNAGWTNFKIEKYIEYLNPEGEIYKAVVKSVEKDMKDNFSEEWFHEEIDVTDQE